MDAWPVIGEGTGRTVLDARVERKADDRARGVATAVHVHASKSGENAGGVCFVPGEDLIYAF